ncbi:PPOX class F420-dependent oxidoreductase [Micromonospora sp. NPDC007230]|uniref:PPOX class F420-dependent oxidoreductase n=1 Tax=Micromonospora sp. NPDC007230 TaxID=3364237 RepID=UPI0036AC413C
MPPGQAFPPLQAPQLWVPTRRWQRSGGLAGAAELGLTVWSRPCVYSLCAYTTGPGGTLGLPPHPSGKVLKPVLSTKGGVAGRLAVTAPLVRPGKGRGPCRSSATSPASHRRTSLSSDEIAYPRSQPLGLATLGAGGQPDVVPVAVEFDGTFLWVGGGATVRGTRKFRNIASRNHKVALVVDDLVSLEPFVARGIRVYGHAEQPFERVGLVGSGTYLRITPTVS